jgi:hypothetical protein
MRARFAYISSLGTTAILVAAALLMLVLVGAIVGFRGWPGGAGDSPVHSVPLAPSAPSDRVALVRRPATTHTVVRASRPVRAVVRRPVATTAGLVKSGAAGPRVVPGLVMQPVAASPMAPQPSSPAGGQVQQPAVSEAAPERQAPEEQPATSPLPGGGGAGIPLPPPPVPLPDPVTTGPSTEQVTSMVGDLLSGGSPPPPLITEITRVADGALSLP